MSLVRLENVSKSFAGDPVLDGVNFRIEEGEHLAIIGRNGTGKSTIFRIITGELEPEAGLVDRQRKVRIASLAQLHKVDDEATIFDIVLHSFDGFLEQERQLGVLEGRMAEGDDDALAEYAELQEQFSIQGGYTFRVRIKQVLQGLGFHPDEFNLPFRALSGGQRTRLMLALVLLKDADLLLLDEPENHLDLEAREWLEDYLTTSRSAIVIVSHDRQMVNAVAHKVCEVERGVLTVYPGNYDAYQAAKALRTEQQQKAFERQQDYIRKEEAWINRFRAKATKAKAVQSRVKRLEKVELVEAPRNDEQQARFDLGEVVRSGAVVLDAQDLTMGYGNLTLYRKVSFQVHRGERVGIIGPNGAGKTTLLRQIAGQLTGLAGAVALGNKVSLGVYEQNHESMNPANDVLSEVHQIKPEWRPEQVRSFLGRFLFTGDDAFKSVTTLSGGELSRVAMAKLILSGANLILLDEPTNHLDIASREALEGALETFPGTIIMVSHDRALIDRLADKLIVVQNGTAEVHLGNYSHYRWKTGAQAQKAREEEKRAEEVLRIRRQGSKPAKEMDRERKKAWEREQRKRQRRIEQLEQDIEAMEEVVNGYESRFAEVDAGDFAALQKLTDEYEGYKADLRALYEEWELLAQDV